MKHENYQDELKALMDEQGIDQEQAQAPKLCPAAPSK